MNFGDALITLKKGEKVMRAGWNGVKAGKTMYLQLQVPDENSKMNNPYIYITSAWNSEPHSLVPWLASQLDVLAEDWEALTL